ncbi:hypothetical protein C8K44_101316 [Aminobacter sp. AP02]|nr:hypothetical protein C8K44_101316 [Aminobacter sp. AP02]
MPRAGTFLQSGRPIVLQVGPIETCQLHQFGPAEEFNRACAERHQLSFAQLAQRPIDVDLREPQRVSKIVLRQRTVVTVVSRPQSFSRFEQIMSRPLEGAAPANTGQPLDGNRMLARGNPCKKHAQCRILVEYFSEALPWYLIQCHVGHAAQRIDATSIKLGEAKYVAPEWRVDDLPAAVREMAGDARPSRSDYENPCIAVALVAYNCTGRIIPGRCLQ